MKKVIALALALVMVCTMALAVDVNIGGGSAVPAPVGTYTQLKPGTTLWFALEDLTTGELGLAPAAGEWYKNDKLEFVPANNKVTVTYAKGAELVKSAGWVQVGADKKLAESWQYQIVLKENDNAVCDTKTCDFAISKVVFKATGENAVEYIFDGNTALGNLPKEEYDYGYLTDEYVLDEDDLKNATGMNTEFTAEDVIYTVAAGLDKKGDVLTKGNFKFAIGNDSVVYPLAAGQKVLRKDIKAADYTGELATKNAYSATLKYLELVNDTNLTGTATVTNWGKTWNAYAIAADGKTVTKVAVVIDDGVATIKVPAYSTGIIYQGTLKNVKAAAADVEVSNPGTGANDVVGVAAALAVVALTSAAAISLKK